MSHVNMITNRAPDRPRALSRLSYGAIAALLLTATGCASKPPSPTVDFPPIGQPATAECPATWDEQLPAADREGRLVPEDATEALLCSYPLTAVPMPLGTNRHLGDTGSLISYLNSLPSTAAAAAAAGSVCLASGIVQHNIVIAYSNRPPATIHSANCAWEQGGNVRYGSDLRTITGYFGAAWNE